MEQLLMRYEGGAMVAPALRDGLVVRNYVENDRERLLDALVPLTGRRWDGAQLDRHILSHEGVSPDQVFVAELLGNIVGTATGWTRGDTGTLHMVSALPEVSGLGVGYAVSVAAVNRLLEKGCRCAELTTDDHRLSAIVVYVRLGFRPVIDTPEMYARWVKICSRLDFKNVIAESYGQKTL